MFNDYFYIIFIKKQEDVSDKTLHNVSSHGVIMVKISKTTQMAKFIAIEPYSYERVAKVIQEKSVATLNEIAVATSLSKTTASQHITMLNREGLVVKTKVKRGKESLYRWVGGIPALENNLLEATSKHVSASLLAETYDTFITDAFALFSILFENNNWEVIVNLKEGLTDTEIHQRLGNDISLDSIRRILTTCDAHNLIKIERICEVAGTDFIRLFEPLFRVENINKNVLNSLIMLRGLASAVRFNLENKPKEGYVHPYAPLLDLTRKMNFAFLDVALSTADTKENELFIRIISNVYDFASDLDRVYRSENWRQNLKSTKNMLLDESSNHILLSDDFAKKCKKNMIKIVGENNE